MVNDLIIQVNTQKFKKKKHSDKLNNGLQEKLDQLQSILIHWNQIENNNKILSIQNLQSFRGSY